MKSEGLFKVSSRKDGIMKDIKEILVECDAFLKGHFLLSSGKHSDGYAQCAKLLMYPDKAAEVLFVVAQKVRDLKIDIVIGPAMGGIIVAYELGRQLKVPAMFTERENDEMTLRRGFHVEAGQRTLITEDVLTTGKSSLETIKALEKYDVEVVGIASIVNRTKSDHIGKYPVFSACELDIAAYDADDCEICKQHPELALIKPGSRKKF